MLSNYFKSAWRNLWKNKVFSSINIFGLSAGLACNILMFLFIQHELSYDKFHLNASKIYRVTSVMQGTASKSHLAITPAPWVPIMKKEYPEIRSYVRLLKDEKTIVGEQQGQKFYETDLIYADSTLFEVFSIGLKRGDNSKALQRPNSIILTEEAAQKYFNKADPIGKTLEINSFGRTFTVEVTAIAKKLPATSHFTFNAIVSLQTLGDLSSLWSFHMFHSYILLNEQASPVELEKKFTGFVNKYIINNPQADGNQDIQLQALTEIHLHSDLVGEISPNGDITYVYVFSGIAIFILLIACFNFTNLSTARSLTRAKEVGLRKVVGAQKRQLLGQFLSESTLFALLGLVASVIIAFLVLPIFNQLSGRALSINFSANYGLIIMLVLIVLIVGLVAGLYPAAVLASFKPVEVLKGKFLKKGGGVSFRRILVTLQFVVSICLIASAILVNQQLNFLKNKKLGFDKENVVIISLPRDADSTRLDALETTLLANGSILSMSASSSIPSANIPVNLVNDGSTDLTKALSMQMLFTDHNFSSTMKMKIVAGRELSPEHATDKTEGFIINQEAVRKFGWKSSAEAIDKIIQWVQPNTVLKKGRVVGVVEDFHITPLKSIVKPLVIHYFPMRFQYLYVRFNQANRENVISMIEKNFKELYPKQSFEYTFLDETLDALYTSEKKLGTIFNYFSFLAILIACLGVLGLSLYSIQQRIKEIGIRKVLGASVASILAELVKEFLKPIFIAAIIATPLAWYVMTQWLEDFAYRIKIDWMVFVVTTLIVATLAILTMGLQSVKAALRNPVKSLRAE